jgi:general stress protein 26
MNNRPTRTDRNASRDDRSLAKLTGLVDKFDTAMLTTASVDGRFHSRPMAIAGRDEPLRTLYFFTDKDSPKVDEIDAESTGLASMQRSSVFVAVTGALAVEAPTHTAVEALWKPKWEVWFSGRGGATSLRLLRFRIDEAEYWDRSGANRWRIFWRTRLALFRDRRLDDQELPGHAKVDVPRARA